MNKKLIFCIVIITLCICTVFGIYYYNKSDTNNTNINYNEENKENLILEQKLYGLESITDYYTVRSCIIKYYIYYQSLYDDNSEISKDERINNLYSLLDKSYIEKYGITLENIENKFNTKINETEVFIDDVLYLKENNIYTFFVKGNVRDLKINVFKEISFIVRLDTNNETFSLFLEDYIKDNSLDNIKEGNILDYNFSDNIAENKANKYKPYKFSYDEYVEDLFDRIRKYIIYKPEKAYELLNCKQSKLNNYSKFESFIKDNYKELYIMTFDSYMFEYEDDCNIYNCKDKYDNFEIRIYCNNPCDIKFTIIKK